MGYLRHKALIVNGWDGKAVAAAHDEVSALYDEHDDMAGLVSPVVPHAMNGGASFLIAPDGSKEGWHHSELGDELMDRAKIIIAKHEWVDWCEVLCGGDDDEFAIIAASPERNDHAD